MTSKFSPLQNQEKFSHISISIVGTSAIDSVPGSFSSTNSTNQPGNKNKIFVPVHEMTSKKRKLTSSSGNMISEIQESVREIRESLRKDQTKELVNLLKKEAE